MAGPRQLQYRSAHHLGLLTVESRPIETERLSVGYSKATLTDVSLSIGRGITAIVGRNGAGKSSLLLTLATLLRPKAGTFAFNGTPIEGRAGLRSARRQLGFVPQHPGFPGTFTVTDMLIYSGQIQGVSDPRDACADALDRFDLGTVAQKKLSELSGGYRQRAFLAQATVHDPPVLLLDEPTVGLDIPSRRDFSQVLKRLASDRAVVFTSHHVEDLDDLDTEIVVVAGGAATAVGTTGQLRAANRNVSLEEALSRLMDSRP